MPTSVLLPLKPSDEYRARLLIAGASMPYVLDTGDLSAGWTPVPRTMNDYPDTGDVNPRRENLDALLLPTGKVFIEGGVKNPSDDSTAVKRGELFNPDSMNWKVLPEADRPRQYHSVALLMPDGAVWVAGSNFNSGPGLGNRELRIEIFEPWYFCGRRPALTEVAEKACHGEEFEIRTPDAASIERVVLVRCSTVTHNFSPDQRHITLEFRHDAGDILVARVPDNAPVAIPGYYLVFVIDSTGRPSTGRFIQICAGGGGTRWPWWWWDEDLWRWLRDILAERLRLDDREFRRLRRAVTPPGPPRRRLPPRVRPHGEAKPGHDQEHGHDHDEGPTPARRNPPRRRQRRPRKRQT